MNTNEPNATARDHAARMDAVLKAKGVPHEFYEQEWVEAFTVLLGEQKPDDVPRVLDYWADQDFWTDRVRSPAKFRQHWDELRYQARREGYLEVAAPSGKRKPFIPSAKRIREVALSYDGMERDAVRDLWPDLPDAAIDEAMHPSWMETPAHPGTLDPNLYHRWLREDRTTRPLLTARRSGESDLDWAKRFWRWPEDRA